MNNISIQKILTSNVISVPSAMSLSNAISLMEENRISCLVVAEGTQPVGILTERDLVMALNMRDHLHRLSVNDLMSGTLVSADIGIDVFEALNILKTHRIRHLVITDSKGNLAGLVTQSDIRNNLGFEYFVEIKQISKIMTKNIVTTAKGATVQDVISKMAEFAISCIVIEEDAYPVGMLTERDIVGLLKNGQNIKSLKIEDVMNSPVQTIHMDAPVHEASKVMNQRNIRRLVVVDSEGKYTGLITQSDIIKRFEKRYIEILKNIIEEKEAVLKATRKQLSDKIVLDNIMRSSMEMAIVASCLNHRVIYINPFAEKIYGIKAENTTDISIFELVAADDEERKRFDEVIEKVKQGRDSTYVSKRRVQDKVIYIETTVSGIRDRKNQLVGFVIMSKDITARKLANEALKNSEKKYRNFVDNALVGIFQATIDGNVLFVNEALLKILEFSSREDALSDNILKRFNKPEDLYGLSNILVDKGKVDNFETEVTTAKHRSINLLLSATVEENVISGVVIDITRARHLEEQLHQSQKMEALGTLTGGIAHEFNNILMVITTCGKLLQLETGSDDPLRENINEIVNAARRAAKLTKGLLTYTRMSTPRKEPTDVNELIKNMGGYLSNIVRKNIDFKVRTSNSVLPVLADMAQIEQVIMNLATNSIDSMPEIGTLEISAKKVLIESDGVQSQPPLKAGSYALLSVADSGIGIDEDHQKRIFEPFFTTKAVGKGTGLGLSIVYGTVKRHDGHIFVESKKGEGTTFKVYLPMVQAEGPKKKEVPLTINGGTGTILLAEDDEAVRNAISRALGKMGYHVIPAVNGEDALNKFKEFQDKIDLLVFDIVMPKMNGNDAYEEIKTVAPDVKILFISGYISDDGIENNIVRDEIPFLQKPVSLDLLEGKIKEII